MQNKKLFVFYTILVIIMTYSIFDYVVTRKEILKERDILLKGEEITVSLDKEDSSTDWKNVQKINVVLNQMKETYEFSFDGGYTWQKEPTFMATENGEVTILVRENGKLSEPVKFNVSGIDNDLPQVKFDINRDIYVGDEIRLKDYVNAIDQLSGLDGEIVVLPEILDTSTPGDKEVLVLAKDMSGNQTALSFIITVKDKNELENSTPNTNTKKVYYRYRTKSLITYTCDKYDCSTYDQNDKVELKSEYKSTNLCDENLNKNMTFNDGCIFTPRNPDAMCTQAITKTARYAKYNNMIVDIIALNENGKQATLRNTIEDMISKDEDKITVEFNVKYKKEPCGNNEVSINGYCHLICSNETKPTCPEGYKNIDNQCIKYNKKTCEKKCNKEKYSSWSEWTTSKIKESENIEVQTKIE